MDLSAASFELVDMTTVPSAGDRHWTFLLRIPQRDGSDPVDITCYAGEPFQTWRYDGRTICTQALRDGFTRIPNGSVHVLPAEIESALPPLQINVIGLTLAGREPIYSAALGTESGGVAWALREHIDGEVRLEVTLGGWWLRQFDDHNRKRLAALIIFHFVTWAASPTIVEGSQPFSLTVEGSALSRFVNLHDWYTYNKIGQPPFPVIRWRLIYGDLFEQSAGSPGRLVEWFAVHLLESSAQSITEQYQLPAEMEIVRS